MKRGNESNKGNISNNRDNRNEQDNRESARRGNNRQVAEESYEESNDAEQSRFDFTNYFDRDVISPDYFNQTDKEIERNLLNSLKITRAYEEVDNSENVVRAPVDLHLREDRTSTRVAEIFNVNDYMDHDNSYNNASPKNPMVLDSGYGDDFIPTVIDRDTEGHNIIPFSFNEYNTQQYIRPFFNNRMVEEEEISNNRQDEENEEQVNNNRINEDQLSNVIIDPEENRTQFFNERQDEEISNVRQDEEQDEDIFMQTLADKYLEGNTNINPFNDYNTKQIFDGRRDEEEEQDEEEQDKEESRIKLININVQEEEENIDIIEKTKPERISDYPKTNIENKNLIFQIGQEIIIGNFIENLDPNSNQYFNDDNTLAIPFYRYIYQFNNYNCKQGFFLLYFRVIRGLERFFSVLPISETRNFSREYVYYVNNLFRLYNPIRVVLFRISFYSEFNSNFYNYDSLQFPLELSFSHIPKIISKKTFEINYGLETLDTIRRIFEIFGLNLQLYPHRFFIAEYFYVTPYEHAYRFICQLTNLLYFSQKGCNTAYRIIDNERAINFYRNFYHLLYVLLNRILEFFSILMRADGIQILGWINIETVIFFNETRMFQITRYFIRDIQDLNVNLVIDRLFSDINYYSAQYNVNDIMISDISFYFSHNVGDFVPYENFVRYYNEQFHQVNERILSRNERNENSSLFRNLNDSDFFSAILSDTETSVIDVDDLFGYSNKRLNLNSKFKRNIMVPSNGSCFYKSLSCVMINKKISNSKVEKSLNFKSELFNDKPINIILGDRMEIVNLEKITSYAYTYKLSIILWFKNGNFHKINVRAKSKNIINLLIVKTENNTYHVCYIYNIKALFNNEILNDYCSDCNSFRCKEKNNHAFCINFNDKFQKYKINREDIEYKERKISNINFVIYADIESIITDEKKHIAIALGFMIVSTSGNTQYNKFSGTNCIKEFIEYLIKISNNFKSFYCDSKCDYCDNPKSQKIMSSNNNCLMKVCYSCMKFSKLLPTVTIVFHNFKGYDSHFIISEFSKTCKDFLSIPLTKEKNLTYSGLYGDLYVRFIDSYSFLASSLDNLSYYIEDEVKKSFFPYEYFNSESKLSEKIPTDINDWRSSLKKYTKNEEELIKKFINEKKNYTLKELMDEYLKNDVVLLFKVFEKFRKMGIESYGIDPIKYISLASYTWDCLLKSLSLKNIKIFRLKDEEIISIFTRKGVIRGGMTMVSSYKMLSSSNCSIFYLDVNNLYGKAMMFPLPYEGIEDVTLEYNGRFLETVSNWTIDSEFGFIFELDIERMRDDKFSSFPLFPYLIKGKLVQNLRAKKKYVAHIITIKQGLEFGYKFKNIKKVLRFKQKPILKDYIVSNHTKRMETQIKAYKNFYKSMNNSIYGKTIENIFKRSNFLFSANELDLNKKLFDDKIIYYEKFNENIFIAETNKIVTFDKPVYLGFTILEYSKYIMFDLYYKELINFSPKLCYVDTDSFILGIKREDAEKFKSSNFISSEEIGKLKIEHEDIESVVALKSKEYAVSFIDPNKKKILKGKGFSTKNLKFIDYLKASFIRKGISFVCVRIDGEIKVFVSKRKRVVKTKILKLSTIKSTKHTVETVQINKKTLKYGDSKDKYRN